MPEFGIVIHGGAGAILKEKMTPELETGYRQGLMDSLTAGYRILEAGGGSLDAVETAVRMMEDNPLFNAGRGAVFTHRGRNEMDAAIMDGRTLNAGAVAGVHNIKNPVSLARLVMEKTAHVLLAGEGAEEFARSQRAETAPDAYFFTERRWQQLQEAIAKEDVLPGGELSEGNPNGENRCGTVGAVALDRHGHLAAATSTGGMSNSRYGRIGDSPIIGAGTYANDWTCAVSTTGHGEYFMRGVIAYDVSVLMEYRGESLISAAEAAIHGRLAGLGGDGGLVAIDTRGNIALPFNTPGMYRGYYLPGRTLWTAIYEEQPPG